MIIPDSNSASTGGYEIDNSLKLENDNAEQLYYTPSSAGNLKTWTYSCWFKRTELSYNMMLFGANDTYVYFETDDTLKLRFTGTYVFDTARVFRDTSAWTHIVVAVDTTQATEADRIKIYFNGEDQAGLFANDSFPAQNTNTSWNNTLVHYVAGWATSSFNPSCYLAEVYNIDGQKLEATDFGEFDEDTGIWKPKAYTGSYGTNGYHLDFENASDLGTVAAGTQHSFVKSNITSVDQALDTPTNNFCTLNPLIVYGYPCTISQGAVKAVDNSVGLGGAAGTVAVNKGKWYWEFQTNGGNTIIGIQDIEADTTAADNAHETAYTMGLYLLQEYNYVNDSGGGRNDGAVSGFVHANSNFYGIALNMDDNEIEYYVNGVKKGPTFSLDALSDLYVRPFVSSASSILYFNFGAIYPDPISTGNADANGYGNFEYAPPSGYYALCSKNLAEFG